MEELKHIEISDSVDDRKIYDHIIHVVQNPDSYRRFHSTSYSAINREEKAQLLKELQLLATGKSSDYSGLICKHTGLSAEEVSRRAAEAIKLRALILNASAGSGKTYQLAYKYVLDVVRDPSLYRNILAVTFTNKATEEMKSRILKEIHLLASGEKSNYLEQLCSETCMKAADIRANAKKVRTMILHDYSRFTVLTIDTFFQRILRAFIKELGLDLNYNLELQTDSLLQKSADALIENSRDQNSELTKWLIDFAMDRLEEGASWNIRNGILNLGVELFKERSQEALKNPISKEDLKQLLNRLAKKVKALSADIVDQAKEALAFFESQGITEKEFNRGIPISYLKKLEAGNICIYSPAITKRLDGTDNWYNAKSKKKVEPLVGEINEKIKEICACYDKYARISNTYESMRANYRSYAILTDLQETIQKMCDEQNIMVLSSTKHLLSKFMGDNEAQVPFIYEKVGTRFSRFMIDEFQDTSSQEWENFVPLLRNAMSEDKDTSVLIVGDIKQSIYRWRGGDWKILHQKAIDNLGDEDTQVITLQNNFRSLPAIVAFNNRIISKIVDEDNGRLDSLLDSAKEIISPEMENELRSLLKNAYQDHAQIARSAETYPGAGYVSVEQYEKTPPVVDCVCKLLDQGYRPCDILILVNRNDEGTRIASDLLRFKQQNTNKAWNFDVMTQEALNIGSAPVCIFITTVLRLTQNIDDKICRALYNQFLGHVFNAPIDEDAQDFILSLQTLQPEEAFEKIVREYDLAKKEHIAYLQALHEQIVAFGGNRIADIPIFLEWWDEQGSKESLSIEKSETAIEISTIHKAKGLERAAVIIPYGSWALEPNTSKDNFIWANTAAIQVKGKAKETEETKESHLFPIKYKKDLSSSYFSDEYYYELVYSHVDNINKLYVALTRAAESLFIFIPQDDKSNKTGGLLWNCLESAINEGDPILQRIDEEGVIRFETGVLQPPQMKKKQTEESPEPKTLDYYDTTETHIALRSSAQRYLEEGASDLSPRNFGIRMHHAFQNAQTIDDIREAIDSMRKEALISAEESEELLLKIDQALKNPIIRSWFETDWDNVRNENSLILPKTYRKADGDNTLTKRPDRVMIKGKRAIIVDYKFGEVNKRYKKQVADYMKLLSKMGYECTGYLWYIQTGEIEEVA